MRAVLPEFAAWDLPYYIGTTCRPGTAADGPAVGTVDREIRMITVIIRACRRGFDRRGTLRRPFPWARTCGSWPFDILAARLGQHGRRRACIARARDVGSEKVRFEAPRGVDCDGPLLMLHHHRYALFWWHVRLRADELGPWASWVGTISHRATIPRGQGRRLAFTTRLYKSIDCGRNQSTFPCEPGNQKMPASAEEPEAPHG